VTAPDPTAAAPEPASPAPVRVVVVDDQQLVRTGFRMVVDSEDGLEVVGEAADGLAAVEVVQRLVPDVVLMDIRMPHCDGIEATRRIVGADLPSRVIVLTTFDLDAYVVGAIRAGASGFLLKDLPPEDLVRAIRSVAAGDALLAPSVTRQLLAEFVRAPAGPAEPPAAYGALTEREQEVFQLLARGRSNAEIAARLVVSETTVKTHVGRILAKLRLRDRVQAVVYAYDHGIVRPGAPHPGG
jgi:DNA-binding NarL/FixJ family response regulator